MSYDQWKTTNPAAEELGPDPEDELERALAAREDRENAEVQHPPECAWESPF